MSRKSSLNHQMHLRMEGLNMIGFSRHKAKKDYKKMGIGNNPSKTMGIHSYNTYESYKQTSKEFIRFIKKSYPDIRDIKEIKEKHIGEYLKNRNDKGLSAWTISKDLAALNKLFNTDLTKKDLNLKQRKLEEITRSRRESINDSRYNEKNYKYQIAFAKGSGARRESIIKVKPKDFKIKEGYPVSVYLKEKGGKERQATILKEYRGTLKDMLEGKPMDKPLFEKYSKAIDNHSFRATYASKRYKELIKYNGYDSKNYKGYDKEVILKVSNDLGHNRLNVVIEHYLKRSFYK